MIRDPSDGSVREKSAPERASSLPSGESDPSVMLDPAGADTAGMAGNTPVIETTTSGLPAASAKDADRHERSREWLENYRKERK